MLKNLWQRVRTIILVVGVALSFVAAIELLRAHQTLRAVHPALGYGFGLLVLLGFAWLVAYYIVSMRRHPAVLIPPKRRDAASASERELRGYARYLGRLMQRLIENARFSAEEKEHLRAGRETLARAMRQAADNAGRAAAIRAAETASVEPALGALDGAAEREVRTCVRDVMLGVTLSPWKSADLIIVLYRNIAMVGRIVRTYDARPRLKEQVAILRDVLAVVATVNFINIGGKLSENLLATVPGLGRFVDDIAQGVGAGLFTSVAGHAAIDRCRAFRGWDEQQAQVTLGRKLKTFLADVRGMLTEDVLPRMKVEVVERMKEGVANAVDMTGEALDSFVRQPVAAAGRGVAGTSSVMLGAIGKGSRLGWTKAAAAGKATGRVLWRGARGGARLAGRGARAGWRGAGNGARKVRDWARRRRGKPSE